jgi:hypothetical protein
MIQWGFKGGLYVEAGPQAGFKVSEEIPNSNIDEFAKSTDVAVAVGLGFLKKGGGLGAGARYVMGMTKVGEFTSSSMDSDFKNGVIQISVLWIFK